MSMIDRTNMSNANIAGMRLDLGLHIGERYSIALLVFFIPVRSPHPRRVDRGLTRLRSTSSLSSPAT